MSLPGTKDKREKSQKSEGRPEKRRKDGAGKLKIMRKNWMIWRREWKWEVSLKLRRKRSKRRRREREAEESALEKGD